MSCGLLNSPQEVKRVLGYQMLSKTGKAGTFKLRFKTCLSAWYFHGPNPGECNGGVTVAVNSTSTPIRYSLSVLTLFTQLRQ